MLAVMITSFKHQIATGMAAPIRRDEGFARRFFALRGYRGLGRPGDAATFAVVMPRPAVAARGAAGRIRIPDGVAPGGRVWCC